VQYEVLVRQLRHDQPEAFEGGNEPDNKSSSHTPLSSTAQESDDSSSFEPEAEHHSIGEMNPAHSVSYEESDKQ
jgi:hypothetical protein